MAIPQIPSLILLFPLFFSNFASAAVFTLLNNCQYTIWAGTLSGNAAPAAADGSLILGPAQSVQLTRPPGFSGRFWARTGCSFDSSGAGKCATGDCGSLTCARSGDLPVTLAEFTLAGDGAGKDFYDVSLVDGYNVGMSVAASAAGKVSGGDCGPAGCVADLNASCPPELRVADPGSGSVIACRSACAAFNTPEYCCTGDHDTPATCPPTNYSAIFKAACPTAYSYAYDDATSTRTCSGSDYSITFCPV